MERWEIKADVRPEDATALDGVVQDLEQVLAETLALPAEAEPAAWLNGLIQGAAQVSDLVLNPDDYDNPRATLALCLIKLSAICIQFKKGL